MRLSIRFPLTLALLFGLLPAFAAQQAIVQKKANLRKDPSAGKPPITILLPDEELLVLDASTSARYLKVRTDEKKVGWVLKTSVQILPATSGTPTAPTTAPTPVTAGGSATISTTWAKPAPVTVAFEGSEGSCAAGGNGGDTATNLRKNRSDAMPEVHEVPWSAIASLAFPAAPASRKDFTKAQLAQIKPYEGVALRTTGFLSHLPKVETGGKGESTNCHMIEADDVDWHIYLVEHPSGDGIDKAVIAETTPRIRKSHNWDVSVFNRWVNSGKPVRLSGFLMLDPEHRSQVGTARGTVWELHPVMTIEVCNKAACAEGEWVNLDGLK